MKPLLCQTQPSDGCATGVIEGHTSSYNFLPPTFLQEREGRVFDHFDVLVLFVVVVMGKESVEVFQR